jgi:hypothetical protein
MAAGEMMPAPISSDMATMMPKQGFMASPNK